MPLMQCSVQCGKGAAFWHDRHNSHAVKPLCFVSSNLSYFELCLPNPRTLIPFTFKRSNPTHRYYCVECRICLPPPMTNGMQWRKRKQTHDSSSRGGGAFSLVALPRLARGKGLEGEKGERLSLRETCHFFFTVTPKLRALFALSLSVPSALLCRFVAYGSVQVFCSVSALGQHGEEAKRSVVARRCLVPSHPL